ncbi:MULTISPECIES: chlorophyll synthesis pathway protein BchC [unclassified Novosphingobium]|uniref:chlorophyll synthesis pathway protein BchC n=1 Tax=unclassified Novosphingobium TaxID=2644732 RepID=UPI001446022B|nr:MULTISPECIES: chlorophyll synthesis pathway protein BchC [unclassified Novosphingobium]NKJ44227.1 3-hydroxyethyl bacteriochlorophyllide a dehydrogenase [Novosphingobium sp. SG720]NMN05001.1 3-hydroxyethyl bacteriochlorophyllide a dehydrogenase [Novosphingobium sp. SG919]NMN87295.1 3-hydroxyethyl bacteriochlorophyllide a dehydrogenase [Novosphingobium sp. SG916]
MDALAVILEAPRCIALRKLTLTGSAGAGPATGASPAPLGPGDVLVDVRWSGISTGTEKLLWSGEMPAFPGMGYPLVPGYESLGRIVDAGADAQGRIGDWVFVPGAACYADARALFGGTAQALIVPSARAFPVAETLGADGVLFALAATALHALNGGAAPDLIIGHGALGRLLARLAIAQGAPAPTVWERNPLRRTGDTGYRVIAPKDDDRHDYGTIYDASGNADCLDLLIPRLRHGGEIVMAGFYANRPSFAFAPAFMRETRFRIAAEWRSEDLEATRALVERGACSLAGVISHMRPAHEAQDAYPETFLATDCLKTVLDWSACA